MNPHEYLRLQLRLEGKEIINDNSLRQVEVVSGENMPLMIHRTACEPETGHVLWCISLRSCVKNLWSTAMLSVFHRLAQSFNSWDHRDLCWQSVIAKPMLFLTTTEVLKRSVFPTLHECII